MRRLWLTTVFCIILPTLFCKAEEPLYSKDSTRQNHSSLFKQNTNQSNFNPLGVEISYGFSSLYFNEEFSQVVKLNHKVNSSGFLFEKTAEAAGVPLGYTIKDFENLCNAINRASLIDDLESIVSDAYFKTLKSKVYSGKSQYVVLAMLQAMRPKNVQMMDFRFEDNKGFLAVKGASSFGLMQGVIHLVKHDNRWVIDQERWYTNPSKHKHISLSSSLNDNKVKSQTTQGLIGQVSPDSMVNRNFLALSKVPYHKSRRAFNFVFVLKKNRAKVDSSREVYDRHTYDLNKNPNTHMHVLWTGSRKMLPEQKIMDQKYPIDFSLANYEDGYSTGQWNLILPNKKPREVVISVLMNF